VPFGLQTGLCLEMGKIVLADRQPFDQIEDGHWNIIHFLEDMPILCDFYFQFAAYLSLGVSHALKGI
jgi:hypothetical protein